jgi:ketosteroid isomerase-like protein
MISGHVKTTWVVLAVVAASTIAMGQSTPACSTPAYHQFDFWVGDWDVFEPGATTSSAHVRVDRMLGGCVLHERYEDTGGLAGESFTIYDAARQLWHQTWVTNNGRLLTIEGTPQSNSIVLAGAYYRDKGQEVRVRGTWTPAGNAVRETAVTSDDGGRQWKPWFDLMFKPSASKDAGDASEDAKAVARLDDEFQAAVKANDVDTIARILADDYTLVTGSGKVFHKQQSIDEARSRNTIYEHQEDTDRTVRVWGDTAVVTAKLWIKGVSEGKPIDVKLWFSDTYVRTPTGWKYVFGQSSLPLPK